jgi:hypothetical protein
MKHGLLFLATLLAFGASPAFAAETAQPVEVATVTIPDCTGKNSPLEMSETDAKIKDEIVNALRLLGASRLARDRRKLGRYDG